jgi:hypothetical protein
MIAVEELTGAMEQRNEALKREMRTNRRVIAKVGDWQHAIGKHIEAAEKVYNVVGSPRVVIEWDPEDGRPYVCISIDVRAANRDHQKKYFRHIRDLKYGSLIVLDVNQLPEADSA